MAIDTCTMIAIAAMIAIATTAAVVALVTTATGTTSSQSYHNLIARDSFIWQLGTALSVFVYMCMIVHSVHSRPKTEGTCCTTLSNLRSVPERPVAESVVLLSCNDGFQEANAIGVFCQQQWPRHYLLFDGIA
eukprot:scpid85292/ scgid2114/ 